MILLKNCISSGEARGAWQRKERQSREATPGAQRATHLVRQVIATRALELALGAALLLLHVLLLLLLHVLLLLLLLHGVVVLLLLLHELVLTRQTERAVADHVVALRLAPTLGRRQVVLLLLLLQKQLLLLLLLLLHRTDARAKQRKLRT